MQNPDQDPRRQKNVKYVFKDLVRRTGGFSWSMSFIKAKEEMQGSFDLTKKKYFCNFFLVMSNLALDPEFGSGSSKLWIWIPIP
jgi:hypothetical protein